MMKIYVRSAFLAVLLVLALLLAGCGGLSAPGHAGEAPEDMPSAGDIVRLGSYPLPDGTPMPIEWRVLAVDGDCALVISERLLCAMPYNNGHTDITWEQCSLRQWLNGEFLDTAFSGEERARIAEVSVPNPNNSSFFWVDGGRDTADRVFCLSAAEAEKYFAGDSDRIAYFAAGDDTASGTGQVGEWWLRSPGGLANHAGAVSCDGHIITLGVSVGSITDGVRPAMWLRFE